MVLLVKLATEVRQGNVAFSFQGTGKQQPSEMVT